MNSLVVFPAALQRHLILAILLCLVVLTVCSCSNEKQGSIKMVLGVARGKCDEDIVKLGSIREIQESVLPLVSDWSQTDTSNEPTKSRFRLPALVVISTEPQRLFQPRYVLVFPSRWKVLRRVRALLEPGEVARDITPSIAIFTGKGSSPAMHEFAVIQEKSRTRPNSVSQVLPKDISAIEHVVFIRIRASAAGRYTDNSPAQSVTYNAAVVSLKEGKVVARRTEVDYPSRSFVKPGAPGTTSHGSDAVTRWLNSLCDNGPFNLLLHKGMILLPGLVFAEEASDEDIPIATRIAFKL